MTCLLSVATAAHAQSVNTVLSSIKVRPTDVVPTNTTATIKAAKNEFESFQIIVTAPAGGLSSISLNTPITLTLNGGSATLPTTEIRAYREVYSSFNNASTLDGASGNWPDALVPYQEDGVAVCQSGSTFSLCADSGDVRTGAFPFNIPGNQNGAIWIDVHVPANQQAGLYSGTVTITNAGSSIGQVAVSLLVRNFGISSNSSLPSLFDVSADQLCRAHGDVDSNGYCPTLTEEHLWNGLYARLLLDHRITLALSDSLNGGTDYSGTFNAYSGSYGSLINGTDSYTHLLAAQVTALEYPWWNYTDGETAAKAKFANWASSATAQNWFARNMFYAKTGSAGHYADEPNNNCTEWGNAARASQWAHSQNSNYRSMVTSGDYGDWVSCGSPTDINVLAPVLDWVDGNGGGASGGTNLSGNYQTFINGATGRSAWMYQSCDQSGCGTNTSTYDVNYPTFIADNTAVQNRGQPWMHYIYNIEGGMYYYDVAASLPTAWNAGNGIWNNAVGGNGEGTLVYPGTPRTVSGGSSFALGGSTHIPVASIRLKMLRDGMEDYEYLIQCENAAHSRATALAIAKNVFPMLGTDANGNPRGSMYNANNYANSGQSDYKTLASTLESARDSLANCIAPGNDFGIAVSPSAGQSVSGGTSAVYTVQTTVISGSTETVNLSVSSSLPSCVSSSSFSPASVSSGGSSQLTLKTSSTQGCSSTTFTVTGTAPSGTHSASSSITVTTSPQDFALSASPTSVSSLQNGSTSSAITVTPTGGFAGTVSLSASFSPAGPSVSLNPTSISGGSGSSTATLGGNGAAPGQYVLTVTGTSGALSHTVQVQLTITSGTAVSPFVIYDDARENGFEDWSWATHTMAQTTVVHSGTTAASFVPVNYDALYLHNAGVDTTSYQAVELYVNGGSSGNQDIAVAAYDGTTLLGLVDVPSFLGHSLRPNTWEQVLIPFSYLGISGRPLRDLYIQENAGQTQPTVYVDDIRLVGNTFAIYDDMRENGFQDWSWATHTLAQTTVVHSGTTAASFVPVNYDAIYLHNAGVDTSQYQSLELYVNGGAGGGQDIAVAVYNGTTLLGLVDVPQFLGHALRPNIWEQVLIPLSRLGVSSQPLRDLYIQENAGATQATVYVDDIRLVH